MVNRPQTCNLISKSTAKIFPTQKSFSLADATLSRILLVHVITDDTIPKILDYIYIDLKVDENYKCRTWTLRNTELHTWTRCTVRGVYALPLSSSASFSSVSVVFKLFGSCWLHGVFGSPESGRKFWILDLVLLGWVGLGWFCVGSEWWQVRGFGFVFFSFSVTFPGTKRKDLWFGLDLLSMVTWVF